MKVSNSLVLLAATVSRSLAFVIPAPLASSASLASTTALNSAPFAIMVEAEIEPDRMVEFLDLIEKDFITTIVASHHDRHWRQYICSKAYIHVYLNLTDL